MTDFHAYAVRLMHSLGLEPDPWQIAVLESLHRRILLNCCRQAGKSTTVAILALAQALYVPGTQVLIVSRSFRQAGELFKIVTRFHHRLGSPLRVSQNAQELVLSNLSRIVCLPCREETIRGYSGITLLIIDEAARVPDDLYRAVRPMLAVSGGGMICLSTPWGKRGFFWNAWAKGGDDWHRVQVTANQIPRITPTFLEAERRALGESFYRQEYFCSFEAVQGLVFPNFARSITRGPIPPGIRKVGGIDFGYRNPFAAIWGHVDPNGNLWLTGEHYSRLQALSHHAAKLPRDVTWACDPSGATERRELQLAGFTVRPGKNALRPGIAAVNARIESARLFVLEQACPNLIGEAGLYRYSDDPAERTAEVPVDEHNHALSALRYLISMLDDRHLARAPSLIAKLKATLEPPPVEPGWRPVRDRWCNIYNEELWTPL